jgi:gamma-glutamylcyclotransferase (GGCT)/AIG2-like uncharacterized protein YtfP
MIGSGHTLDKYPLIVQGLPYLVDKKGIGHNVAVDVFKVSGEVFADLDRLEGHPNWYKRKQVFVKMENGNSVLAWIYFNPIVIRDNDVFHKTYVHTPYVPQKQAGYKPQRTYNENFQWSIDDEKPFCTSCYSDLRKVGSWYECKGCNEFYTQVEIDGLIY